MRAFPRKQFDRHVLITKCEQRTYGELDFLSPFAKWTCIFTRIYLSRVCSSGDEHFERVSALPTTLSRRYLRVRCVHASFLSVLSSRTRSRTFTILEHLLENASSPVGRVLNDADHLVKPSSRWHDHCRGAVVPIATIIAAANRIKHVYCAPWFDTRPFIAWHISFRFPMAIIRIVARSITETTGGMTSSHSTFHIHFHTSISLVSNKELYKYHICACVT